MVKNGSLGFGLDGVQLRQSVAVYEGQFVDPSCESFTPGGDDHIICFSSVLESWLHVLF